LLFLAFIIPPAAIYLLFLGWLNRRPRPVFVSGPWDFAGVLFALGGLLLFGGPALFSSLEEDSRLFWLIGAYPDNAGWLWTLGRNFGVAADDLWWLWLLLRAVYFVLVAGGAAWMLWRCRRVTSVYNVDADALHQTLPAVFQRLGLTPTRTGERYRLTPTATPMAPDPTLVEHPGPAEGVIVPPTGALTAVLAAPAVQARAEGAPAAVAVVVAGPAQPAVVRVQVGRLLRHATLTWSPADFALRKEVEQELARALGEAPASDGESLLGGCLTVVGISLLALTVLAGLIVVLIRWLPPPK
jgi:hypothetical protein